MMFPKKRTKPPPPTRHYSVYDMDVENQERLISSSYRETIQQLDVFYGTVKRQLLRYQHPVSGLFPVMSPPTATETVTPNDANSEQNPADRQDEEEASVRDSIYCAAAVWSLFQSYRRIDDDRGKSYELGQSVVKCMRGILECWIRQAGRLEKFKKKQCAEHALHSTFQLSSGAEIQYNYYRL